MNNIILKRLSLNNFMKSNDNVEISCEFGLPATMYSAESTITVKLTDDQARRVVAAALSSIQDACVQRLESVRQDVMNMLPEMQPALPPAEQGRDGRTDPEPVLGDPVGDEPGTLGTQVESILT